MAKVYSTEIGRLCHQCEKAAHTGHCSKTAGHLGDGNVRIQYETKGRKGAGMTLITGIPLEEFDLKTLLKALKKQCGVGGAIKKGVLELQGDQREAVLATLTNKSWNVKIAGG